MQIPIYFCRYLDIPSDTYTFLQMPIHSCRYLYKCQSLEKANVFKFDDVWIQTRVLWCRKRQLWQLCHNHCLNKFHFLIGHFRPLFHYIRLFNRVESWNVPLTGFELRISGDRSNRSTNWVATTALSRNHCPKTQPLPKVATTARL